MEHLQSICVHGVGCSRYSKLLLWVDVFEQHTPYDYELTRMILVFLGPGSPLSHGSAIPTVEHETRYVIRMIFKAQTENYKAIAPSRAATEEFVAHMKEFNKRTVWSDNCSSWLRQGRFKP
jgi:hypothetical protein